eukprot:COSAG03_NODE_2437_length_2767_cov_267.705397_2_plen_216_part_00
MSLCVSLCVSVCCRGGHCLCLSVCLSISISVCLCASIARFSCSARSRSLAIVSAETPLCPSVPRSVRGGGLRERSPGWRTACRLLSSSAMAHSSFRRFKCTPLGTGEALRSALPEPDRAAERAGGEPSSCISLSVSVSLCVSLCLSADRGEPSCMRMPCGAFCGSAIAASVCVCVYVCLSVCLSVSLLSSRARGSSRANRPATASRVPTADAPPP